MDAFEFASKLELALLGHMSSDEFWKKIEDLDKLYQEGYKLGGVCIASEYLISIDVPNIQKVCVVGYPYGDASSYSKQLDVSYINEVRDNYLAGEKVFVDYVPDFRSIEGNYISINDLINVRHAVKDELRLIVESGRLNQKRIDHIISIAESIGFDVIKTSTGTYKDDPSPVERIKKVRGTKLKVKASGGIKDLKTALECLDAGADIIGSSSALEIFKEFLNK